MRPKKKTKVLYDAFGRPDWKLMFEEHFDAKRPSTIAIKQLRLLANSRKKIDPEIFETNGMVETAKLFRQSNELLEKACAMALEEKNIWNG